MRTSFRVNGMGGIGSRKGSSRQGRIPWKRFAEDVGDLISEIAGAVLGAWDNLSFRLYTRLEFRNHRSARSSCRSIKVIEQKLTLLSTDGRREKQCSSRRRWASRQMMTL